MACIFQLPVCFAQCFSEIYLCWYIIAVVHSFLPLCRIFLLGFCCYTQYDGFEYLRTRLLVSCARISLSICPEAEISGCSLQLAASRNPPEWKEVSCCSGPATALNWEAYQVMEGSRCVSDFVVSIS